MCGKGELARWIPLVVFFLGHLSASNLVAAASSCSTFSASPSQLNNFFEGFTQFFGG